MSLSFTKQKFLRLCKKEQHKKCAQLMREIYLTYLEKKPIETLVDIYQELINWMGLHNPLKISLQTFSNLYHIHLEKASLSLKEHNFLPDIRRWDKTPQKEFGHCHLYLDNLRSAYNVGNILRTVEALRLGPVYFGGNTPTTENPKVRKTSMGSWELVSCIKSGDILHLPKPLIILETIDKTAAVSHFAYPQVFTLVLGNEEYGVSDAILREGDLFIQIPLFGKKNSLNAASAFAICAHYIRTYWDNHA